MRNHHQRPREFPRTNLWAKRQSACSAAKTLVFAGHTDVVLPLAPPTSGAATPSRPPMPTACCTGAVASDMKTSLAAMVVACEEFLAATPEPAFNIALLTSDEEGPANDGTVVVCQALTARGEKLDWCVVGEPTSVERTGRHDQEWPPGHHELWQAHGQRHTRPHCLPAPGTQPHPHAQPGAWPSWWEWNGTGAMTFFRPPPGR